MKRHVAFIVCAGIMLLFLSCEEQLPAYQDPSDLFSGTLRIEYKYAKDEIASYVYLTLVNRYDETLEDTATFGGSVSVTLLREQSYRRTFTPSASNLFFARSYQPTTRMLRVDPGDSVVFRFRYDYTDDSRRSLLDEIFMWGPDPECPFRMSSNRELFSIAGRATVFDKASTTVPDPIAHVICYVRPFFEKPCSAGVLATSNCRDGN